MATKLGLYNSALRLCSERRLASLTENREPRRLLDAAWGNGADDGALRHCLELGQWTFAMRTVQLDYSPSVEPPFGYRFAFDQPADMVDVSAICSDEFFNEPLLAYADERHFWYADLETIYVRYVSSDASYGGDLSLFPSSFAKLVEAYLANEIVGNLTQGGGDKVAKILGRALRDARSNDAMRKPTQFMPAGSWLRSRQGYGGNYGGRRYLRG